MKIYYLEVKGIVCQYKIKDFKQWSYLRFDLLVRGKYSNSFTILEYKLLCNSCYELY